MPPTYRAIIDQIGDHFLVAHLKIVQLVRQIISTSFSTVLVQI